MNRRSFLRWSLLSGAAALVSGRLWGEEESSSDSIEVVIQAPQRLSFTETSVRNTQVAIQMPRWMTESNEVPSVGKSILCAVEASNQSSFCGRIKGGWHNPPVGTAEQAMTSRHIVWIDLIRLLGLPRMNATYYVHASYLQYRSSLTVVQVTES
jgi:hypothetical protein